MNRHFIITIIVSILFSISAQAQQSDLAGKWLTPDKDVIEFYPDGKTLTGKQISSLNYKKITIKSLPQTSSLKAQGFLRAPL